MNSNAPWTIIERALTDGIAWRCTEVQSMQPGDEDKRHRIIISAKVDNMEVTDGSANIQWGFDGGTPQVVPARGTDKLDYNSIIIEPAQRVWVKLIDRGGFPSDKVHNLHVSGSLMGDDAPFAYFLKFELQRGEYVDPPLEIPELTLESLDARIRVLETHVMATRLLV